MTELLDRHWAPVLEYATLCTNSAQAAKALAQAAFRRQLDSAAGPTWPWRCHLLGAVIETTEEWDADERRSDLREGLRTGADGQEPPATVLRRDRHLLLHGFQQLPEQLRSLLWHTEVEAEDLAEAAFHAGLDLGTARIKLPRARAQLRAVCRQAHLDFAPEQDCRSYNRLIDVSIDHSQVTETVPDLHHHLTECAYCRAATDQLDHTPERLPVLLAEAVLGFGAEDYLTICRARRSRASTAVPTADAPPQAGPLYTPAVRARTRRARRAARRRAGLLFGGIVVTSGVLLGAVAGILLSGSPAGPSADAGAAESTPSQVTSPQATPVGNRPTPVLNARFHNVATGLCLDIGNRDAVAGATAVTSTCAPVATQLWDLGPDGLLRSHADPGLCLDSAKVLELEMRPCTEATDDWTADFQFVLSDGGLLIPGRNSRLAVTPAATREVVGVPVVLREPDASFPRGFERWLTEVGSRP